MRKEGKRVGVSELLKRLYRRSAARCEGHRLGLDCVARLTADLKPQIHHINGNPENNEMSNLVLLCQNCHYKVLESLSEKRRKAYVKKVAEKLDKFSFSNKR